MTNSAAPRDVLMLWDNDCGFCARAAAYASEHFTVEAIPYQSVDVTAYGLTSAQCAQALQVVDRRTGRTYAGSDAVAVVLETRPGLWRSSGRLLRSSLLHPLAQPTYRLVARNRHRLPGSTAACALPTPSDT